MLKFIDEHRLKPAAIEATPLPTAATSPPPPPPQMTPGVLPPQVAARSPRLSAATDSASYTDIELTTMRSVIARRLTLSKAVLWIFCLEIEILILNYSQETEEYKRLINYRVRINVFFSLLSVVLFMTVNVQSFCLWHTFSKI